jgi:hypothetical protein
MPEPFSPSLFRNVSFNGVFDMKAAALLIGLSVVSLPTISMSALAGKPCEELKSEIAAKLDAKGVVGYTLDAVPNEEAGDKTVVGSCEGGTKKITYVRGGGAAAAPATEAAAPAAEPAATPAQ